MLMKLDPTRVKLLESLNDTTFVPVKPDKVFERGDVVEVIAGDNQMLVLDELGVVKHMDDEYEKLITVEFNIDDHTRTFSFRPYDLQLSRQSMSAYRVLKQEVLILNQGWDMRCDNLLRVITHITQFDIFIRNYSSDELVVEIRRDSMAKHRLISSIGAETCVRFGILKKALIWCIEKNRIGLSKVNVYGEPLGKREEENTGGVKLMGEQTYA